MEIDRGELCRRCAEFFRSMSRGNHKGHKGHEDIDLKGVLGSVERSRGWV